MSLLSLMAAGSSGPAKPLSIAFDGNSITAGAGTPYPLIRYVVEYLTSVDSIGEIRYLKGGEYQTAAISGQQWSDMAAVHADVDTFWDPDRTNVLVVSEDSNVVFQGVGKTFGEVLSDTRSYFAAVRAVHPGWRILMWGNLPRSGTADQNAELIALNNYWRDNWEAEGLVGWIDMRAAIPQFDHDGSSDALFAAYADAWSEAAAPFVHPSEGTYEANTGTRALARQIALKLVALDL